MDEGFFRVSEAFTTALARHNEAWERRFAIWRKSAPPPWWGRNLILSPEIRAQYEMYLPFGEFCRSVRSVARCFLVDESWLPLPLRKRAYLSLADFWEAMPESFGGRVSFHSEEVLPFLCALADPPRFGTMCGRYPAQLRSLAQLGKGLRVADIGCGVGLNTLEIAYCIDSKKVVGITAEPLEVWMAQKRVLPHDEKRTAQFRKFQRVENVSFQVGKAEEFAFAEPMDVIVCNGLIGGRFFHSQSQYDGFLLSCRKALAPKGSVWIANRFHEGCRFQVEQFMERARALGFECQGIWQSLVLR